MILAHPNAPLGSVTTLRVYDASDFNIPDAVILCRNTAPLIEFALALLRRNVPCHVIGRDIQVGLDKLIDSVGKDITLSQFLLKLQTKEDNEFHRLIRKGKRQQAESYSDKCSAIRAIAKDAVSVSDIKVALFRIFADGDGITLSTIHKAKGLEWETVFLLDWHLLPSKYAESADALTQEKNLQYVAVTRAKLHVKFINGDN